uniref:Uncharacterized protein n=1 Tax=Lepeophtheirus salmonis TaxID=72036 RepID=A0A0K2UX25_LEPSM
MACMQVTTVNTSLCM